MSYKNLDQQNLSFLKELLSTNSPSGYEVNAAKVWQNYVNQFAEVSGDVLNNSIGVLNPQAEFKIMIAGHYDEKTYPAPYGLILFGLRSNIAKFRQRDLR